MAPDGVARAAYYDVLSTPSTLFNGKRAAGHGGTAQDALKKFNQYRFVIDDMLKDTRAASIKLEARRAGEQVRITAEAEISTKGRSPRPARLGSGSCWSRMRSPTPAATGSRFTATSSVPSLAAPKAHSSKEARDESRRPSRWIDCARASPPISRPIRRRPGREASSRGSLPPIALDRLSVVAIVQDDQDRSILHAVIVPLEGVKASKEHEDGPR